MYMYDYTLLAVFAYRAVDGMNMNMYIDILMLEYFFKKLFFFNFKTCEH